MMNKADKCFCGHDAATHQKYINGGKNKKGSRFCCGRNNCGYWNLCDIGVENGAQNAPGKEIKPEEVGDVHSN